MVEIQDILTETKHRMQKTLEDLTRELATIRTGRASVHILDQVSVDYYGAPTPVNQLATLHSSRTQPDYQSSPGTSPKLRALKRPFSLPT